MTVTVARSVKTLFRARRRRVCPKGGTFFPRGVSQRNYREGEHQTIRFQLGLEAGEIFPPVPRRSGKFDGLGVDEPTHAGGIDGRGNHSHFVFRSGMSLLRGQGYFHFAPSAAQYLPNPQHKLRRTKRTRDALGCSACRKRRNLRKIFSSRRLVGAPQPRAPPVEPSAIRPRQIVRLQPKQQQI